MEIFERIKNELRGYNIDSVAKAAEVAPATLYFWLDGRTQSPHLRTIVKVAKVMGYELDLRKIRHLRAVA